MTIKEIREYSGLSRAEFSRKYDIPVRSLENWESEARSCPEYLVRLLAKAVSLYVNQKTMLEKLRIFSEKTKRLDDEAEILRIRNNPFNLNRMNKERWEKYCSKSNEEIRQELIEYYRPEPIKILDCIEFYDEEALHLYKNASNYE